MRDQIIATDVTRLAVVVHRDLPADWPLVGTPGEARLHVFQTREFIETWTATRGTAAGVVPYFIEVRDQAGARVMLLPLVRTTRFGLARLSFMDGGLADYNAPVLYPTAIVWTDELAAALWERILAALPRIDLVELQNLPAEVGGLVNPVALVANEVNDESAHGSRLTLPWAEIEASQAQLKTIKRKWRALEKHGPVAMRIAQSEEEVDRFLGKALAQKQRRFDETQVSGFDRDPAKLAYFKQATARFHAGGKLLLCVLTVGDEIVATAWNLVLGSRVYEILIGFEAGEWTKYSCGRILNILMLQTFKERGFAYLDHGIGDEGWKLEYCDTHVSLKKATQVRSVRGAAELGRRRLINLVRASRAWQALKPLKWAVLRRLGTSGVEAAG